MSNIPFGMELINEDPMNCPKCGKPNKCFIYAEKSRPLTLEDVENIDKIIKKVMKTEGYMKYTCRFCKHKINKRVLP